MSGIRFASPLIPVFIAVTAASAEAQDALRVNSERIQQRIEELSRFGRNPDGGVSRVAFSEADIRGREYVMGLMREAGLEVEIDAAGNLIGRRKGSDASAAPIVFGSHIDSVPHGGNYDWDVGSLGAIEVAQVLHENGITTRHPLEVVVFTDEEGGLIGSRAWIGALTEDTLEIVSHSGKTIREGLVAVRGDPRRLDAVLRQRGEIAAFIELHIEQGAFLYDEGIEIGVVEGIVGIWWWDVVIEGNANHAGTTPMNKRNDSLLAAARYVIAVNEVVTGVTGRQVGTVGKISAEPGAHNVIPGRVLTSLEIRDLDSDKVQVLYERILERVKKIEEDSGTEFTFTEREGTAVPAPTDERMRDIIEQAATDLGLSFMRLPSSAGHDAQDIAKIAPTGMIFVPSRGGISHSPREFTSEKDMANGANVLLHTVLKLDGGALDRGR